MEVYFTILDVFKISSLGYNYAAIWKFKKNGHFWKKSKSEMGIYSEKKSRSIVTNLAKPISEWNYIFYNIGCFQNK